MHKAHLLLFSARILISMIENNLINQGRNTLFTEYFDFRIVDNIPATLVQADGMTMIGDLTKICNRILRTGELLIPWTQSLIITSRKRATYSCARTIELSVLSVIGTKSC